MNQALYVAERVGCINSIGIFFTLMIIGLAASLPHTMTAGLQAHGVVAATASRIGHLPPISILFAAFLGYNPIQQLVGSHVLASLSVANRATLTGRSFFPHLISAPFRAGLDDAFLFAIIVCLIAAAASFLRGETYHYGEPASPQTVGDAERPGELESIGRAFVSTQSPTGEEQHAS